jgi:tetratricopeptide (TPR) repeat protein
MYLDTKYVDRVVLFIYIIVGCIVYFNSLDVPFYFDDADNIQHPGLRLESLSFSTVKEVVTQGSLKTRPVSNLSFALNYYLGEYRVQGYHALNIIIHISAAFFLYLFIKLTLNLKNNSQTIQHYDLIPFFTALIWLVHPVGTQSVTYLVQRMNSMAAMLYILSLLLYAKARQSQTDHFSIQERSTPVALYFLYIGSFMCGLLALGSKENAAVLPVTIFLYEWYFFRNLSLAWIRKVWGVILIVLVMLFTMALWVTGGQLIEKTIQGFAGRDFTLIERLLTQLRVVLHYIDILLYPQPDRLVLDYDFPLSTSLLTPITTAMAAVVICVILAVSIRIAKRQRVISFFIIWYFLNLVIESSIIPLEMVYEHRTYLPSVGIIVILVIMLFKMVRNAVVPSLFMVSVCVLYSIWTIERNSVWRDPVVFWESNMSKYSEDARIHANLGNAYVQKGDLVKAELQYNIALEMKPDNKEVLKNLGNIALRRGDIEMAKSYLNASLKQDNRFSPALMDLGVLLIREQQYNEAEKVFSKLLGNVLSREIRAKVNVYLAQIYMKMNRYEDAKVAMSNCVSTESDSSVLQLLKAELYLREGKISEAISEYERAIISDDNLWETHYNLARLYSQNGDEDTAEKHYRLALKSMQVPLPVRYNYANTMLRQGKYAEAAGEYIALLKEFTYLASAYNNLGLAYVNIGDLQAAEKNFATAAALEPDNLMMKNNLKMVRELIRGN